MKTFLTFGLLMCLALCSYGQLSIDVEGNYVVGIPYNEVRIPSKGGTLVDIAKDLEPENTFTFRARVNYTIAERHVISALAAPLSISSSGTFDKDVRYSDRTFNAGTTVKTTYKFNSYRITYRYLFVSNEHLKIGAGLTGKIREANITFENSDDSADDPDLGFVPLVNFYVHWKPTDNFGLLLEGDALGTKQGRAEDVFAGITYDISEKFSLKGGYRVLEGGADVTENYNFAWINYAALGAVISF